VAWNAALRCSPAAAGHHPWVPAGPQPRPAAAFLASTLAEFPIIGSQLQQNIHSLRAKRVALLIGLAGFLWGARNLTQASQPAMAEIWNIPGKQPASSPGKPAAWRYWRPSPSA
jgi:hypothetical protein